MATKLPQPDVTIILPVFNDAEWVARALESCLAQTHANIEIVVVDDASTDNTASIVEEHRLVDTRIRLIQQRTNQSAFQARRVGIEAARAPYVLFLDGDDELVPEAASTALDLARSNDADVVGFGSHVVWPDGSTGGHYEAAIQPRHNELVGEDIVDHLFPVGKPAQGQLWRYLFSRNVLLAAYNALPQSLLIRRVNDLPIAFLAISHARKYVSTPNRLYRYFFRRGASGHGIASQDDYRFTASAIDSIDAIGPAVSLQSTHRENAAGLLAAYESARLSVTAKVLEYVCEIFDEDLKIASLTALTDRVGRVALIAACADFSAKALPLLAATAAPAMLTGDDPKHIVLRASNLGIGGAQGVVIKQAEILAQRGRAVTIALDSVPDTHFALPPGVQVAQIPGRSLGQRIMGFAAFCRENEVDLVIDHYILYNDRWPQFALAAAESGVPTIGWIHSFTLRPVLDGNTRMSLLERYLPLLATVVVLSRTDVAYWKLRGLANVVYLPNPPSPLLEHLPARSRAREAPNGRLEIVWWGRLQQSVKQVREVIEIGALLGEAGVDFRISIIGPESPDLTTGELHELARQRGIDDQLVTPGALHGDELVAAIQHAHVLLNTSVIEGYPLAIVEAQALGLPVVMYGLPWLAILDGNEGVIQVEQGDRHGAARSLSRIAAEGAEYEALSKGSLRAAHQTLSHDFHTLYHDLVRGRLAAAHSPEPTYADMSLLLEKNVEFVERLIRRQQQSLQSVRAETNRQRRRVTELTEKLRAARRSAVRVAPEKLKRDAPSVASRGLKGWVQRVLPATMRQAGFYARHQYATAARQHDQLLAAQTAVTERLSNIEALLTADTANNVVGNAVQAITTVGSDLAIAGSRLQNADERLSRLDERIRELSDRSEGAMAGSARALEMLEKAARVQGRVSRSADEAVWSNVFHDTVVGSAWFLDRALSPGRWAVGYPFLYVLYRVLDEVMPSSILELGLGQSTKVVGQYADHKAEARHVVVEHDPAWLDAFATNFALSPDTQLVQLDLVDEALPSGDTVRRYAEFVASVGSATYDLIIIDGPFGFDQAVSRIDVLDILPTSLGERFVIMLDDAHRRGELATIQLIEEALQRAGVPHYTAFYRGQKDVWIAVSADLRFLTTL